MKKVLLFLFLSGLSLFAQSKEYIDKLYYAIKYNNTAAISNALEHLISYNLNLNNMFFSNVVRYYYPGHLDVGYADASPLIYAIGCGNIEAIDTLLKFGANVEQLTDISHHFSDGDSISVMSITPLMYAAACSPSEKVVSFLISKGANVNTKDKKGKTALMYSVGGDAPVLLADGHADSSKNSKILINARADVNAKDYEGRTALMYAAYNDYKETVDLLIKNKANVNAKDNKGETALMYACMQRSNSFLDEAMSLNKLATVKSLIKAGANINEVNDTLRIMLDPDGLDGVGYSALLYAISTYIYEGFDKLSDGAIGVYETIEEYEDSESSSFLEVIKFLIDNGANVNIRSIEGETPLSLSKEFPKLTKFLKDNGAYLQ